MLPLSVGFNLDALSPSVYSGPRGSYFGYSVEFYTPEAETVLIGAPKANTTQPNITEGGPSTRVPGAATAPSVGRSPSTPQLLEFKSHQWFGATIRSHNSTILVSVRSPARGVGARGGGEGWWGGVGGGNNPT
uniref:Uncharacterized protein n=1 Tax=Callorhinchus milii TaxID=7868 RepID=A0A4W3ICT2_CALMI